ncbi:MAG: NAD(+) synthase [Planctomycetota bacterium]|nr:MAG: NAD(+) synthase [Planctomycetota bacterium]
MAADIEASIQGLLAAHSAEGVIIGLSGGIDSAVLTALAVCALGSGRVYAYHLHDRHSEEESRYRAQLLADWLGIGLSLHSIDRAMRKKRVYRPVIMRIMALSGFMNRYLNGRLHRMLYGESPFISTLRKGRFDGSKLKKLLYDRTVGYVEESFNARHKYRRHFLERRGEEQNCLVLGAANRSECMVGWFVKDGIDDMPFSPLNGLYKTQVRQLARHLNLPAKIQKQAASPDMAKGITDEHAMGISYAELDIILHGLDNSFSDEQIIEAGVTEEQIAHVRMMNMLSAWKRTDEPEPEVHKAG